jgi:hypothetical protein
VLSAVYDHFSESGHGDTMCLNPLHSVNCGGSCHSGNKKKCLVFVDEKGIQKSKVKEGFTFPEAQK